MNNPLVATLCCFALYFLGFRVYGKFLAGHIFRLDPNRPTPAHTLRDEVDYIATSRYILFGRHYASITGLADLSLPLISKIGSIDLSIVEVEEIPKPRG